MSKLNRRREATKRYAHTEKGKSMYSRALKKYYKTEKGKIALSRAYKKYIKNLKEKAYTILGGKCVKCGFSDQRALQIDHINGGGNKERDSGISTNQYYVRIIHGSTDYQLLCANCNWIKRIENNEVSSKYRRLKTTI